MYFSIGYCLLISINLHLITPLPSPLSLHERKDHRLSFLHYHMLNVLFNSLNALFPFLTASLQFHMLNAIWLPLPRKLCFHTDLLVGWLVCCVQDYTKTAGWI